MGQTVRLSDLVGKNIVNIYDGIRLGSIQDSDMIFDAESGIVEEILVPGRGSFFMGRSERGYLHIPWQAIHKIGREVVIVDLGQSPGKYRR